jgi:uncharacterized protein (DUF1499 family)
MFSVFLANEPDHSAITLLDDHPNTLPPCPSSPNCVRRCYQIKSSVDVLYPLVLQTLHELNVQSLTENKEKDVIKAVIKIGIFKDDVTIKIEETQNKNDAVLHIRSASRKGAYDLGVNKRRLNRFMHRLADKL